MNNFDPSILTDSKALEVQMNLSLSHFREIEGQVNSIRGLAKYHVAFVTLVGYYLVSSISKLKLILVDRSNFADMLGETYVVTVLFIFMLVAIGIATIELVLVLRPFMLIESPPPSYRLRNLDILLKDGWDETKAWNVSTFYYIQKLDKACAENKTAVLTVLNHHKHFVNWAIVVMVLGFVLMVILTIIV